MNTPTSSPTIPADLTVIPADCPLLAHIEARLTEQSGTLLIHFYGPMQVGPDAKVYVRSQRFNADGQLIKHKVSIHHGKSIHALVRDWATLPGLLRRSPEVQHVDRDTYVS